VAAKICFEYKRQQREWSSPRRVVGKEEKDDAARRCDHCVFLMEGPMMAVEDMRARFTGVAVSGGETRTMTLGAV